MRIHNVARRHLKQSAKFPSKMIERPKYHHTLSSVPLNSMRHLILHEGARLTNQHTETEGRVQISCSALRPQKGHTNPIAVAERSRNETCDVLIRALLPAVLRWRGLQVCMMWIRLPDAHRNQSVHLVLVCRLSN
jgi:hypothetical protein